MRLHTKFALITFSAVILVVVISLVALRRQAQETSDQRIRAQASQILSFSETCRRVSCDSEPTTLATAPTHRDIAPVVRAIFERYSKQYPDFVYAEPSITPLNPAHYPDGFGTAIINRFRRNPGLAEVSGTIESHGRQQFYLAHPVRMEARCSGCHNQSAARIAGLSPVDGSDGPGPVIGATVVTVPTVGSGSVAGDGLVGNLALVGIGAFLLAAAIMLSFRALVMQRLAGLAAVVQKLPDGSTADPRANVPADEFGQVARVFHDITQNFQIGRAQLVAEVEARDRALSDALGTLAVVRREAERRVQYDPLTDLLNHRAILERLITKLQDTERDRSSLAVILIDLDGFKFMNEAHGHRVGDKVLQSVAKTLRTRGREQDLIGRHGGDEFMVVMPDVSRDDAYKFAESIRAGIDAEGVDVSGGERIPLHSSIGISVFPEDATKAHDLIGTAEYYVQEGKRCGGNLVSTASTSIFQILAASGEPNYRLAFESLEGLVRSVDAKDSYTRNHSADVARYALALAQAIGLPTQMLECLEIAGLLHDVGKIGIPDYILKKPGKLTDLEYAAMKRHVELSELIVKDVPNLSDVVQAIAGHHERWDGGGYPRALKGEQNALLGRILAVSDAYSAMTMDRPYRKALSRDEAFLRLREGAGTQFDPNLVEPFIDAVLRLDITSAVRAA